MSMLLWIPLAIVLLWLGVLLAYARPLLARWREPVLRHPVLVIESDDWGAGPLEQSEALLALVAMLGSIRDRDGRPALMTLGVVFEVPDGPRIAATDATVYHALPLSDSSFDAVRAAMIDGISAGVFVPQLHGQSHYWAPALLAAAQHDALVRDWLTAPEPAATEDLPSHLQTRWVDATSLPSTPLASEVIDTAIARECDSFHRMFGRAPKVAVPTTFVWTKAVERAWVKAGVTTVITPGHRATCRDATGAPAGIDARLLSGGHPSSGLIYLVRDAYFEPIRGHSPNRLVTALATRTRQGRACLVETHRINFLRARAESIAALQHALTLALAAQPELRFIAPEVLAQALSERDPNWVETRFGARFCAWVERSDELQRFRRIAQVTGLRYLMRLSAAMAPGAESIAGVQN